MVLFLTPDRDQHYEEDIRRLRTLGVATLVLTMMEEFNTVQNAVHQMSAPICCTVLLPDDFRRHNKMMDHVRACALHIGMQVMPLTHYIQAELQRRKGRTFPYLPIPDNASVRANARETGVGKGIEEPVEAG